MSTTTQPCPGCNPKCQEILDKINELIYRQKPPGGDGTRGLVERFAQQIYGKSGPGTQSWINHEGNIVDQQKALKRKLEEYDKNGCGDPPTGAWSWATRPAPQPSEWRGGAPDFGAAEPSTMQRVGQAAVDTGKTVGTLYIIYRIVRFIPSLFPPLWETIPANAAIP